MNTEEEKQAILSVNFQSASGNDVVVGFSSIPSNEEWNILLERIKGYIEFTNVDIQLIQQKEENGQLEEASQAS